MHLQNFSRTWFVLSFLGLGCLGLADRVQGQSRPAPRLYYVSPMGGQAGTTVDLTLTGLDLEDVEGLHFSFAGARVEMVGSEKANLPPATKKGGGMKNQPGQVSQKFKVALPAQTPLGIHDVRIVTRGGLSNPRAFVVGDLKEVNEQEPNDNVDKAQKVDLNTTINGLIAQGTDVDYFLFPGKKGQRVVLSCLTTSIDSKLPALLQLYHTRGRYLGSNKDYRGNDALLDAVLPEDGDYYVRLNSFTYTQGGADHFYRLTIATTPWIDAIFPSAIEPGKETRVTVYGRNLPQGVPDPASLVDGRPLEKATVTIKAPSDPRAAQRLNFNGHVPPPAATLDGFEFRLKNEAGSSNSFLVTLARAPVVLDEGDNDTPEKAQKVNIPCEISGRIDKKGDRDWFVFSARKGQALNIDVFGDRLGFSPDLSFLLQNEQGNTLTEQDDNPDITANQFYTRTDDPPSYRFQVPADGNYRLMVTSKYAFMQHGPREAYLVRITPEEPDFRLVAMPVAPLAPDAAVVGQAGNQAYSVYVFRQGNFTGDITLSGEDLPPGVSLRPQVIAGNQKLANLVVSAAPDAPPYTGRIKLIGSAMVGGQKLQREVRAAGITWPVAQAVPVISRLDRELVLAVRDRSPFMLTSEKDKIGVQQGEKVTIPVRLNRLAGDFKLPVNVVALNLPTGLTQQQPLILNPGQNTGTIVLDAKNTVLPGNFTLVLRGQTHPVALKQNQQPKATGPNLMQASGPITLTIVPKTLGKLALNQNTTKIPAGKEVEVVIRINRLNEYGGPFKVEMLAVKGLAAREITIPAGQDEARLLISASDSKPGQTAAVTIRATAMFNDTIPIVQESKLNVAITK